MKESDYIRMNAREIIERNKGDIKDLLNTLNQMIQIYSVINSVNDYLQVALDFNSFKRALQIELSEYNSKRYLCSICKLKDTCQNNFDYECIEASDFLFKPKSITYTVKDDFLDSLIDKNHNALRG